VSSIADHERRFPMFPAGRRLIHFSSRDGSVDIGFVDYSGHRAARSGHHYTARHSAVLTHEELFDILQPVLQHAPGNEPDMRPCDGCGEICYTDDLDFVIPEGDDYLDYQMLCPSCKGEPNT
jgi:hypothetical protein